MIKTDVLIIGASASGLMCAIEAGKRGRDVVVLDHANKAGKKILMSGGGRCNFTNIDVDANNYISHNPHFCKSALSRYTQWDFIAMVNAHNIPYHERDLGKLFCDDSAKDILNMLLDECKKANIKIRLNSDITAVEKVESDSTENEPFIIHSSSGRFQSASLVIACGGLSIPKMCASPLGYKIAEQFGHHIWPTSAGLVPFTLQPGDKEKLEQLSGISVTSDVSNSRIHFNENILFTHRGLSGPAILQISSYWKAGEPIEINLLPESDVADILKTRQAEQPNIRLKTTLNELLPKRLVAALFEQTLIDKPLQELSSRRINEIASKLQQWQLKPNGTEGYRTAEVTLGGVDCNELSSKTMGSNKADGLYFIGEVVDVTGWLGGYNFQWAWSSGWCAGQVV
ncbi:MAG: NAD(P)/FAD-dependent oxidoreductase [Gammaproteobacteria bacterium]